MMESPISDTNEEDPKNTSRIKSYLQLIRPPFLVATSLSMILGTTIAWVRTGSYDPLLFAMTITAGVLIHAGTNASNDYFDHLSGNDDVNQDFVAPYTGGSRMIQLGRVSPYEVLALSLSLLAGAIFLGAILASLKGYFILILGAIGVFSGFCYAAPPIRLASRGIGEPLVGLNFGVLLVLGAYYIQTDSVAIEPILASIPIATTITAVLWINEFPDFAADKAAGKDTLVVRLGTKRASRAYIILVFAAYLLTVLAILGNAIALTALLALSTSPLGIVAVYTAKKFHDSPSRLAPSCSATVVMHLLFVTSLIIGYLLLGLSCDWLAFVICFVIMTATSLLIVLWMRRRATMTQPSGA